MASAPGICGSFKQEILQGWHNIGNVANTRTGGTAADTLKAALYYTSATLTPDVTTAYNSTGEMLSSVFASNGTTALSTGYTAGGITLANGPVSRTTVTPTTPVAYWSPTGYSTGAPATAYALSWSALSTGYNATSVAYQFDTLLIYNSTQGNKAIAIYTFGATTLTSANFSLTIQNPVTSSNALIQLA